LRGSLLRVLEGGNPGASVVIGGDLNLVGSTAPLDSLVRGLDGGKDLAAVDTYRLSDGSMATWRNAGQVFTPGRLDYLLVPSSAFIPVRAFPFDVGELSDSLRERLGLDPEDSVLTSDHLPLVVDLSFAGSR
jgi:hypothetical protein